MKTGTTIFSDFLKVLGVPHTGEASDKAFRQMSFQTLFGFSRLLNSYSIPTTGVKIQDKNELSKIPVPFMAQEGSGFVIVTSFGRDARGAETVNYIEFHKSKSLPLDEFIRDWSGIALLAYPTPESREPNYTKNHWFELAEKAKTVTLIILAILLGCYGFIQSGLWRHTSTVLLTLVNLAGIGITWLLLLKTLKVHSAAADSICGVIEKHGCDTVLEHKASTFFGLFSWSEVGITYFSLTTLFTMLFPQYLGHLALINGLCLPFTVWSIWYQKFRIKTWCTLCVTTQTLLWLQFFCYLLGGWWHEALPLGGLPFFLLGATYVAVMLMVNRVMTFIKNRSAQ